ncbi:MAG: LacI family DNA-binding transcriptional regulator [Geminicoccaceae bacterium]
MDEPADPARRRRKRGARFAEIAAEAGVSPATVDRVLNERDSVADATRRKVLAAAVRLRVPRLLPQPEHALVHLDIILPRNETPFFRKLAAALHDGASMLDRWVIVHRRTLPQDDVRALAAAVGGGAHRRAGFILAAPDLPELRAAVQAACARGERGVAVVTELPGLSGISYVGIDNRRAGAAAGDLMGRMTPRPGRVLGLGSSALFLAHRERHAGFAGALAAFAHLSYELIDAETQDEAERCFRATRRALAADGPPVVGIYHSGAGSAGIRDALRQHGGPRPSWIGHEISEEHVVLLRSGEMDVAIDQDPAGQAIAALQTLLHAVGVTDRAPSRPRAELRIHTRFSLP